MPGHPLALLSGLPLDLPALGLVALVVGWAIALPGTPPRVSWLIGALAALALVRVTVGMMAPAYGLAGAYRLDSPALGTSETLPRADRIEPTLDFRGDTFPAHFINNVRYLNFYTPNQPKRDLLPVAATWTGQLVVPNDGQLLLTLEANGVASLEIGAGADVQRVEIGQAGRVREVTLTAILPAGLMPIQVTYLRPEETMPWIVVRNGAAGADGMPVGSAQLVQSGTSASSVGRDGWLYPLAVAIDALLVGVLAVAFVAHLAMVVAGRRVQAGVAGRSHGSVRLSAGPAPGWRTSLPVERVVLALYFVLAVSLEVLGHGHLFGRAVILSGGNDWLAYEGFARDLLLNGPLLTEGRALGQGVPFYYQPLYIYWVALTHLLLGESLFAPLFMNAVLGILAGLGLFFLTRALFGRAAAFVALPLFEVYRQTVFAPTAGLLLSENLLFPLVPVLLLALAKLATSGRIRLVVAAGLLFGLAGLARTTPLALLPPALLILLLAWRRLRLWKFAVGSSALGLGWLGVAARLLLLAVVCTLTVGLATTRNYVVSGRPVPITSSAGANLWETHRPSSKVDLSRIDRDPLYERLGFDRATREVAEFIRQDPAGYVGTLVPMFLFAVGVQGAVVDTWDVQPLLFGLWIGYLVFSLVVRQARALPTWFLHAFIWSHLAQMTVFFSHQYGFRLILPMYVAMVPVVAIGLVTVVGWLGRIVLPHRPRLPAGAPLPPATRASLLCLALVGGAAGLGAGEWRGGDAAREAFYGLNGDAAIAVRQAARPDLVRQADSSYFVGDDSRSTDVAYLHGLAYPTLRWFDGARGLVLPPAGEQALYVLPDRAAADFARRCLGDATSLGHERDAQTGAGLELVLASAGSGECGSPREPIGAPFAEALDPTARLLGLEGPASIEPGRSLDVTIHWEAFSRPRNRARPFVRLIDDRGRRWGQAETTVYPSSAWRAGERAIGVARLEVEPTLSPGIYHLAGGFSAGSGSARLVEDGQWGSTGLVVASGPEVRLVSRSAPIPVEALTLDRRIERDLDGGLRLVGVDLDRETALAGERVRLTSYLQRTGLATTSGELTLLLRRSGGQAPEELRRVPADGTYPVADWKPGEMVRDTWDFVLPPLLPAGPVELALGYAPAGQSASTVLPLGMLTVQEGDVQATEPDLRARIGARFAGGAELVGLDAKGRRARAGDTVDLTLIWRTDSRQTRDFQVAVALLDDRGRIVAQQESEPAGGKRPFSGWTTDEYIEDGWKVRLPRDLPSGKSRLAVSLVDLASNRRVSTETGATWVDLPLEVGSE